MPPLDNTTHEQLAQALAHLSIAEEMYRSPILQAMLGDVGQMFLMFVASTNKERLSILDRSQDLVDEWEQMR